MKEALGEKLGRRMIATLAELAFEDVRGTTEWLEKCGVAAAATNVQGEEATLAFVASFVRAARHAGEAVTKARIAADVAVLARRAADLARADEREAYDLWRTVWDAANGGEDESQPEPDWNSPDSEEEAAQDLLVARAGGALVAARRAAVTATSAAIEATGIAMAHAAHAGRAMWTPSS